jgi:hypothetical protein
MLVRIFLILRDGLHVRIVSIEPDEGPTKVVFKSLTVVALCTIAPCFAFQSDHKPCQPTFIDSLRLFAFRPAPP